MCRSKPNLIYEYSLKYCLDASLFVCILYNRFDFMYHPSTVIKLVSHNKNKNEHNN